MMALFETHQRFKGHFLNELRVSFKDNTQITDEPATSERGNICDKWRALG